MAETTIKILAKFLTGVIALLLGIVISTYFKQVLVYVFIVGACYVIGEAFWLLGELAVEHRRIKKMKNLSKED